jgi:hypothetical protein
LRLGLVFALSVLIGIVVFTLLAAARFALWLQHTFS